MENNFLNNLLAVHMCGYFALVLLYKWGIAEWFVTRRPRFLRSITPCNFCFIFWASLAAALPLFGWWGLFYAVCSAGLFPFSKSLTPLADENA